MAAEVKKLARELRSRGFSVGAHLLEDSAHSLNEAGLIPDELPAVEVPKALSRDQLILPETALPQYVLEVLQRAERAGIGVFEAYHLSDFVLDQNSNVEGWNSRPENWYWEQIRNGRVSQDAPQLPGSWVLIDKTQRPDHEDSRQLDKNDPLGPLLARLRKKERIENVQDIPSTSRFAISSDELTQVVLPEIAKLLGVETSQVRLPKAIEFNVIGNFEHPEWGITDTWEWFDEKFGDNYRLVGGRSNFGGLANVHYDWSGLHVDGIAFRPLVVVSPKA